MTLVAGFKWHDGRRYVVADTLLSFDTGTKVLEADKMLVTDTGIYGFAGDSCMTDWMHHRIVDGWNSLDYDSLAREAHEYALEKYAGAEKQPDADVLCVTREYFYLICSSGSTHCLRGDFHAIGSGERFAHGFWHSRHQYTDPKVFGQAMVTACSRLDMYVGGPITFAEV